jgi:hypothetical protein
MKESIAAIFKGLLELKEIASSEEVKLVSVLTKASRLLNFVKDKPHQKSGAKSW